MGRARRLFDWMFRNRRTGDITIGQVPNVPLGLFIVATVLRRLLDATGGWRTALDAVALAGLLWWAVDEVLRGVNPWRRMLGAGVLAAQLVRLLA